MNKIELEQGRAFVSQLADTSSFLAMPIRDIESHDELFGMDYLRYAPWLYTQSHFERCLSMREMIAGMGDAETKRLTQAMVDEMGVSPAFALLAKLRPLPHALASDMPEAFAEWEDVSNRYVYDGTSSIGSLVAHSSTAAARAVMELARRRTESPEGAAPSTEADSDLKKAQLDERWAEDAAEQFPAGKWLIGATVVGFVLALATSPAVGAGVFGLAFLVTHFKERQLAKDLRHARELRIEIERRTSRR